MLTSGITAAPPKYSFSSASSYFGTHSNINMRALLSPSVPQITDVHSLGVKSCVRQSSRSRTGETDGLRNSYSRSKPLYAKGQKGLYTSTSVCKLTVTDAMLPGVSTKALDLGSKRYQAVIRGSDTVPLISSTKCHDYAGQIEPVELPLCECYVVDVIARRFKAQAEAQGIRADFRLALPEHSGIADTDLCIVLGNLMENAIHACAAQERGEKFLHVLAKAEGPDVFISVENSCGPEPSASGGGLGISSVQAVAKNTAASRSLSARAMCSTRRC